MLAISIRDGRVELVAGPLRSHHTSTSSGPWDGPANEARLPSEEGPLRAAHAWVDDAGDPNAKGSYRFIHHEVADGGTVGAANEKACSSGIGVLHGGRGGTTIPDADKPGVEAHLQTHMDDAMPASTGTANGTLVVPKSYVHVTKAVFERPWAIQPVMLRFIADFVRFRGAGGVLSSDEIEQRLAAAKAQNGERIGGVLAGAVAVIPIYGLISQRQSLMSDMSGGTSIEELRSTLRAALADRAVQAIIFDIDSPGGSVDGLPEFAAELRAARGGSKPIVGQVNTLAASAAYWLAAQMSEIVMTPSGEVGSIGVFAVHEDLSKAAEMAGVKTTLISAGTFKTEGNQFEPLTDEARGAIQGQVDDFYTMFVGDVARGRGVNASIVTADYGQGRTFLAKQALAAGMVDRIDTLEATINRLQPAKAPANPQRQAAAARPTSIAASGIRTVQPDRAWNKRMKGKIR